MSGTLVDSHVHFHDGFQLSRFLDAAQANFVHHDATVEMGALIVVEMDEVSDPLKRIREQPVERGWQRLEPSHDSEALWFSRREPPDLVVLAGRQITTRENLELLALCTDCPVPGGISLRDGLGRVTEAGGVAVVPWGFGKWWFGRGRVMRDLLARREERRFFLGDHGGRPQRLGQPALLEEAETQGIPILVGSDPLPWAAQQERVGCMANRLPGQLDPNRPTQWLRAELSALTTSPEAHGVGRTLRGFVADQWQLRTRRR